MKSLETKNFEAKVVSILNEQKQSIINEVSKHIEYFKTIEFIKFNFENPFKGELKNKIFLTYCDHYSANSSTDMSIAQLRPPQLSMDDRGYIKGVAIDLDAYLKLRSAKMLSNNFHCVAPIYFPKFRKSKNSESYKATCNALVTDGTIELNNFVLEQQKVLNETLRNITGCSLLHYLRDI